MSYEMILDRMKRIPPSVDEACRRGLIKSWIWIPQPEYGSWPKIEIWTLRGKQFLLSEAEAEAFAEGVMANTERLRLASKA